MARLGRGFPNNQLLRPIPVIPVAYESTGVGQQAIAASASWAHTIGGSALVVGVIAQSASSAASVTAQVGATAMTQLGKTSPVGPNSGFYFWSLLFGLLNPPTGNQTISLSIGGGGTTVIGGNSVSYRNVGGFGTVVSATGLSSAPALSVSSARGQMVAETFSTWNTSPSGYTQTSRYSLNVSSPARGFLIGDALGAPTVNFSAAACDQWEAAAVPLIPV